MEADIRLNRLRPPTIYQGFSNDYFRDKEKNSNHKNQNLNFCPQGFRIYKPVPNQPAFTADNPNLDSDQSDDFIKSNGLSPQFYNNSLHHTCRRTLANEAAILKEKNSENEPVLRFYAYRVDGMPQEKPFLKDNWRVRKFVLYFFTVDKTMKVWENRQVNSGFTQGLYLQRLRYEMPAKENICYEWFDLDVGLDIDLSGHFFHIYDCDEFTRFFFEKNGASVKEKEDCPTDPYLTYRNQQASPAMKSKEHEENQLSRFIRTDGQKLCFEVFVEENFKKTEEIRRMVLKFYVFDETLELVQISTKNSGYDPASVVIRRQKIPKNFYNDLVLQIGDKTVPKHYVAGDLKLGETLLLFGRKVTICDCDEFTRKWFRENLQIDNFQRIDAATLSTQHPSSSTQHPSSSTQIPSSSTQPEISPWRDRQGGYLDSLQNCLHLYPRPKVYNDVQKMYYAEECLRFEAKLVSQEAQEKERRFIICFYVGDQSLKIIEQAIPSLSIPLQTFLSRRQVAKFGMENPPVYFTEQDFTIGSVHKIFGRIFEIFNCDEHVINFARQQRDLYTSEEIDRFRAAIVKETPIDSALLKFADPLANSNSILDSSKKKIEIVLVKLKRWQNVAHRKLYRLFFELDLEKRDVIDLRILQKICSQFGMDLEEDVLKGVFRKLGSEENFSMKFPRFLHALRCILVSNEENSK